MIDVPYIFKALIYSKSVCSVMQRFGLVHVFICREPAVICMNNQGLTNLYGSVIFYKICILNLRKEVGITIKLRKQVVCSNQLEIQYVV